MEHSQSSAYQMHTPDGQLKESIRDMIRLQRDYLLSDEVFWQLFNTRVLLNEPIDVNELLGAHNISSAQA